MLQEEKLIIWINNLIEQKRIHDFYNSTLWEHKRNEILKRDKFDCCVCKNKGQYSKADTVHHIMHVKTHPHLALTNTNLISVCRKCHEVFHPKFKEPQKPLTDERW